MELRPEELAEFERLARQVLRDAQQAQSVHNQLGLRLADQWIAEGRASTDGSAIAGGKVGTFNHVRNLFDHATGKTTSYYVAINPGDEPELDGAFESYQRARLDGPKELSAFLEAVASYHKDGR